MKVLVPLHVPCREHNQVIECVDLCFFEGWQKLSWLLDRLALLLWGYCDTFP